MSKQKEPAARVELHVPYRLLEAAGRVMERTGKSRAELARDLFGAMEGLGSLSFLQLTDKDGTYYTLHIGDVVYCYDQQKTLVKVYTYSDLTLAHLGTDYILVAHAGEFLCIQEGR